MEIEIKDKTAASFKEGDIVALKVDCDGNETDKTNYYLIAKYNTTYYCLISLKTGEIYMYQDYVSTQYLNKEDLATLIKRHDGKVYRKDKTKLIIEENN